MRIGAFKSNLITTGWRKSFRYSVQQPPSTGHNINISALSAVSLLLLSSLIMEAALKSLSLSTLVEGAQRNVVAVAAKGVLLCCSRVGGGGVSRFNIVSCSDCCRGSLFFLALVDCKKVVVLLPMMLLRMLYQVCGVETSMLPPLETFALHKLHSAVLLFCFLACKVTPHSWRDKSARLTHCHDGGGSCSLFAACGANAVAEAIMSLFTSRRARLNIWP